MLAQQALHLLSHFLAPFSRDPTFGALEASYSTPSPRVSSRNSLPSEDWEMGATAVGEITENFLNLL